MLKGKLEASSVAKQLEEVILFSPFFTLTHFLTCFRSGWSLSDSRFNNFRLMVACYLRFFM